MKIKVRDVILASVGSVALATTAIYAAANHFFKLAIVKPDKEKKRKSPHSIVPSQDESRDQYNVFREAIASGKEWLGAQKLETVYTKSFDGLTLAAELLDTENAKGTVILVHSFCSLPQKDFGNAARFYHENGYRVLMPYQRANGKSEGQYISYGINECRDVVEWAGLASRRYGANSSIFLHGLSMGATSVLMATGYSELPPNVHGVIADSAFISPYSLFRHIVKRDLKLPLFPFMNAMEAICKEKAGFGFSDYSTLEALDDCTRPVLFIHGDGDALVPVDMAQENYEVCHTEKELVIINGAQHALGYYVDKEKHEAAVKSFLDRYTINV